MGNFVFPSRKPRVLSVPRQWSRQSRAKLARRTQPSPAWSMRGHRSRRTSGRASLRLSMRARRRSRRAGCVEHGELRAQRATADNYGRLRPMAAESPPLLVLESVPTTATTGDMACIRQSVIRWARSITNSEVSSVVLTSRMISGG